ncbi:RNA polymerase sigma factor [Flexivirga caeni]|nr:sigma-70 family RNA polymerase sigma factor [Flexivirga caeni]
MTALTDADDRQLLALVRRGDADAMAALWSRHYPATLAAARRISRQPKDAEEFASDAFCGMLHALSNDSGPATSVRGYLLTAVRNQATTRARRAAASDVLTDEITDFEDTDHAPLDPVAHHAELGLVREAFATLPPSWQSVLWRTAVDHEKNTDIAADLGKSPNAVAALARRARLGFRVAYIRAHGSTHGIAPECAPFVPRLVELLPDAEVVAAADVRRHVEECHTCKRRLADLRLVDRDLGALLLPALLALGSGIAWATAATAAPATAHVAGGVAWLHWARGVGQSRKVAIGGAAAAGVLAVGMCSAYAIVHSSGQHAAAAPATTQSSTAGPKSTAAASFSSRSARSSAHRSRVSPTHVTTSSSRSQTVRAISRHTSTSASPTAPSSQPRSTTSPVAPPSTRPAPTTTSSTSRPVAPPSSTTTPTRTTRPTQPPTSTPTASPTTPPCWLIFCWLTD